MYVYVKIVTNNSAFKGVDKMERIFISPARYVQGRNALKTGVPHIERLGTKPLLLCDDLVWDIAGAELSRSLTKAGLLVTRASFSGESSIQEVHRIQQLAKDKECDAVLGLGGGKTIDTAKAISDQLNLPVGILPTVASTDAPTSAISVIYSENGTFESYQFYKKSPELIIVDTQIISQAPVRLLTAGIADALATLVEVRAVSQTQGKNMAGGAGTLAARAIAEKCEETLFKYGIQAVEANRAKVVTEAFEAVVEANTLLSGIGFESGGLAAAHAIHNGFSVVQGEIHSLTHGEKVAYATLTQLFLENRSKKEIDKFIEFYQKLQLPTTLAEIKLQNANYEDLLAIGKQATVKHETSHRMPFSITPEAIADALIAVDAYVKSRK